MGMSREEQIARVRRNMGDKWPSSMDEHGVWEVYGEDPNCDFGGPHHEPHLFTVEGTFGEALDKALVAPRFWQWGSGGRLKQTQIIKTSPAPQNDHVATMKQIIREKENELIMAKATVRQLEDDIQTLKQSLQVLQRK